MSQIQITILTICILLLTISCNVSEVPATTVVSSSPTLAALAEVTEAPTVIVETTLAQPQQSLPTPNVDESSALSSTPYPLPSTPEPGQSAELSYPVQAPRNLGLIPSAQLASCDLTLFQQEVLEGDVPEFNLPASEIAFINQYGYGIQSWHDNDEKLLLHESPDGIKHSILLKSISDGSSDVLVEEAEILFSQSAIVSNTLVYIDFIADKWALRTFDLNSRQAGESIEGIESISFSTRGNEVFYVDDESVYMVDNNLRAEPQAMFSYLPIQAATDSHADYQLYWSPMEDKLFVHGYQDMYLVDAMTDTACYVDFFSQDFDWMQRVLQAAWSADGQKLALLVTDAPIRSLVNVLYLIVWDVSTNQLVVTDLDSPVVTEIAWSPTGSSHIAVIKDVGEDENRRPQYALSIIDLSIMVSETSSEKIYTGGWGYSLRWSNDRIAVGCPTFEEGRLCLFTINE